MQSRKIKLTLIQHCWAGDFVSAWWSIQQQMPQPILSCQFWHTKSNNITQIPQAPKKHPFHQLAQHRVM
jgi:hypothetical protein